MSLLSTLANLATAIAVIVGVVFGLIQVVHLRRDRHDRAALELVHAMLSADYVRSIMVVHDLPVGATVNDITGRPEVLPAAIAVGLTFETLGYAVFRRVVPLAMADEVLGGAIRVAWNRLRPYVDATRAQSGSEKAWEWFQWLCERLEEQSAGAQRRGAQVEHRGWRG